LLCLVQSVGGGGGGGGGGGESERVREEGEGRGRKGGLRWLVLLRGEKRRGEEERGGEGTGRGFVEHTPSVYTLLQNTHAESRHNS